MGQGMRVARPSWRMRCTPRYQAFMACPKGGGAMPFALSEEQALIRRTAREFADKVLAPVAVDMDKQGAFPKEVREGLAELGFWGLAIPAEHGGAGLDLTSLAMALEEMARRSASAAVVLLGHSLAAMAAPAWAPRLASGEALGSIVLADGALAAQWQGQGPLTGSARLLPLAGTAAVALVPAPQGGFAVVPKDAPGAAWFVEPTLGLRGARLGQVVLRSTKVEHTAADLGVVRSVGLAAIATGLAQAAVEESVKFALDRQQFHKPIASFEGIRARIADMGAGVDASRALLLTAAAAHDAGQPAVRLAAEAKVLATEAASVQTRSAIRLHGGSGFLKDFAAERLNRDARMLPLLGGDSYAQRDLAARSLLG
jgi:butyryl-CoA dehydrogenase